MIAKKPEGALGVNLFSSINGTVCEVTEEEIIVEATQTDFLKFELLKKTTPCELVEESGLVGLGGAGFPTWVKLGAKLGMDGMLIINAAECEPILSHNIVRIEKESYRLMESMKLIMDILLIKKGTIAIKGIHREIIRTLRQAAEQFTQQRENASYVIQVKELENLYPMGEERAIIREVKGILLSPDSLPSDANTVVVNAETAFRIYDAVVYKKPLMDKDMTVAGKLSENAASKVLLDIPIGMPVSEVFRMAGGLGNEYGELIMGGPFTGKRTSLEAPVIKTTGGLIAAEEFMKGPETIGLLVCACGADKNRLIELSDSMGSEVVGVEYCKQAHEKGSSLKCENPGHCPGQVEKILKLK
jgi:proline reductase-associated electron transfer protein PrdC